MNSQDSVVAEETADAILLQEEHGRRDRLLAWLAEHKATVSAIETRVYAPGSRGVHAARDIKKDEEVLIIPTKCLVTSQIVYAHPLIAPLKEKMFNANVNSLLTPTAPLPSSQYIYIYIYGLSYHIIQGIFLIFILI